MSKSRMRDPDADLHPVYKSKLMECPFYLGMIARSTVELIMKVPNTFCIRVEQKRHMPKLKLSVSGEHGVHHVDIQTDGAHYWMASKKSARFKEVNDLVDFFADNDLYIDKEKKIRLTHVCPRPDWYLLRSKVVIDNKLLGSGNFCDVFRGKCEGEKVAIKICHAYDEEGERHLAGNALVVEAHVMSQIRHPNVIKVRGSEWAPYFKFYGLVCDRPPVMIAMELCAGGALVDHLQKEGDAITDGERIKYCYEAACGMNHLHSKDLIHRDLAARNCLINKNGIVKISDFGLSLIVQGVYCDSRQQIPLRWMAPESLVAVPQFSKASDCWAFGVLMFEVFNLGQKPWPDWENKKIATHIRRLQMPDFPDKAPKEIKQLVTESLWVKDTNQRPTFERIVKDLKDLGVKYPAPPPEECTVSRLPNVNPLSLEDCNALHASAEKVSKEELSKPQPEAAKDKRFDEKTAKEKKAKEFGVGSRKAKRSARRRERSASQPGSLDSIKVTRKTLRDH